MFRIYLRIVRLTYERVEVKKKFPSDFVSHPVVPKYREKIKKGPTPAVKDERISRPNISQVFKKINGIRVCVCEVYR